MFTGSIFVMFTIGSILIAEKLKSDIADNNDYSRAQTLNNAKTREYLQPPEDEISTSKEKPLIGCPSFPLYRSVSTLYLSVKCPKGFTYYEDIVGSPLCYMLTEKQRFPPKCPYSNYMEDNNIEIYTLFQNESIWIKATRNLENQFGEFESFAYPAGFLDISNYNLRLNTTIADKNCMIRTNCRLYAVSCNERHRTLCIYSYDSSAMTKYCRNRNKLSNCISTSFAMDNKCYCQMKTNKKRLRRKTFCEKLAEPDPFQNHLILTYLKNDSPCFLGVEQCNGTLRWSSSKNLVDYTHWKPNVDFSKRYAAVDFASPLGWILTDDTSLKCAICSKTVPYRTVTIQLYKARRSNKIEILINNVFDIHLYSKFRYVFACYTDYDSLSIKKQIKDNILDINISDSNYRDIIEISHSHPAYYWCETVQRPNLTRVFSNKILAHVRNGVHNHEFSLLVNVPLIHGFDPYTSKVHVNVAQVITYKLAAVKFVNVVRPMKITKLHEKSHTLDLLLHISTFKNRLSAKMEFDTLLQLLEEIPTDTVSKILNFSRSELCLESVTILGDKTLTWPESGIGVTALPKELCLGEHSVPVTRKCEGNFTFGAKWSKVHGECVNKNLSHTTVQLYSILRSETTLPNAKVEQLLNLTNNVKEMAVIDVHFISEIIQNIRKSKINNCTKIANIYSNIMSLEKNVVNQAQYQLNSTDIALNALDAILENIILLNDSHTIKSNKLIVYISEITLSNIRGVALRKQLDVSDNFSSYDVIQIRNSSMDELLSNEETEVGVLFSTDLIEEILNCQLSSDEKAVKVIVSFFYNDALFNDPYKDEQSRTTFIVNVVIPSLKCDTEYPFHLLFKSDNGTKQKCVHWNYGVNENHENIHGKWKMDSLPSRKRSKNAYSSCYINHLTHFSVLITTRSAHIEQTPEINLALQIVTSIGCGLSLVGLFGIFLIGIFYKSWRKRKRNIIMLNFSAALAAQMILLYVSDLAKDNTNACIAIGASLHYTTIASFGWMLIVAVLQYRRFVLVYEQMIPHLIFKSLIVGWCMPLVLVIVCLIFFPESYNKNNNEICYPDGSSFYGAVVAPVSIFVLINLFVFVKILLTVCKSKVERYGGDHNEIRVQVLFAILLFFLLGMSWFFGLGITFTNNTVLSFIFCITATLQGFVVFVCFILMNKQSRVFWVNVQKILVCAQIRFKR